MFVASIQDSNIGEKVVFMCFVPREGLVLLSVGGWRYSMTASMHRSIKRTFVTIKAFKIYRVAHEMSYH